MAEKPTRQQGHEPFPGRNLAANRHSRQAYSIIKTIHLMNFTNADTLAPIMMMRRSETARAWGIVCSHQSIPRINNLDRNNAGLGNIQQVGRVRLRAATRLGLLL
jgi:hypothetical protein